MRLRWFELSRIDRGASLTGIAVGGAGTLAWAISVTQGPLFSQGGSGFGFATWELFTILSLLFLAPFLSALGLLLLPLKDEQRGILGFISLIGSLLAFLPAYLLLVVVYCTATQTPCF